MKRSTMWRLGGAVLLALALGTAGAVPAQQSSKKTPSSQAGTKTGAPGQNQTSPFPASPPGDSMEMHVYAARYVAADELATLITNLYQQVAKNTPPVRVNVGVDARANRIIVAAAPAVWKELEPLLQKLDTNAPPRNDNQKMVTLSLKGIDDKEVLETSLQMLLHNNPDAKFTFTSPTSMLLYGDDKTVTAVSDLCDLLRGAMAGSKELDRAPKAPTAQPLQLRLLWLVDGAGKDAPGNPLAGELQTLLPVLERLGIQNPRVITNGLVNTTVGGTFKSSGFSSFDDGVKLEFSGKTRLVEKMPYVTLQLKLTPVGAREGGLANVETDIQAPFNHFVLLGMTPLGKATAIFVLQVSQP